MAIIGPIAPFSNVPIEADFYQPNVFIIENIQRGITTQVTTTVNQNYVVGQLVRFIIPPTFGIRQLNEMQGYVISIVSADTVEVDIDSRFMDAFTSSSASTQPQIMAIGDVNTGQLNSNGIQSTLTYIPGSFINISPQ